MDRLQVKTSKTAVSSPNTRSKKTDTKASRHKRNHETTGTNANTAPHSDVVKCRYCTKVFYYPKYAMKHVLKRHPEFLGDYLCDDQQKKMSLLVFEEFNESINELKKILLKLHSEMEKQRKLTKAYHSSNESCSSVNSCVNRKSTHLKNNQKQTVLNELSELKDRCESFETNVRELDRKYSHVVEGLQQALSFKENIIENAKSNQKMQRELKTFKNELVNLKNDMEVHISNMQDIFSHEMNQQKSELEERISQFNKKYTCDLKTIDSSLESRLRELNMTNESRMVEKFEHHLQNYLKHLLLTPKQSKNVPLATNENCFSRRKLKNAALLNNIKLSKNSTSIQIGLSRQIDAKLKKVGISSNKAVTDSEFKSKYRLIRSETRKLNTRYQNFKYVREKLERQANIETQKLLISPSVKRRITFAADRNAPTSILKKGTGAILKKQSIISSKYHVSVPTSSEFVISKDPVASCSKPVKQDSPTSHNADKRDPHLEISNFEDDDEEEASEISLGDIGSTNDMNVDEPQTLPELNPSNRFESMYAQLGNINKMLNSETSRCEIKSTSLTSVTDRLKNCNSDNKFNQTLQTETGWLQTVEEELSGRESSLSLETLNDFDLSDT